MRRFALCFGIGLVGFLVPVPADAHFKLNSFVIGTDTKMPVSWMSQDAQGGPQKNGPCAAMPNTGGQTNRAIDPVPMTKVSIATP